nr:hypothetical protein ZK721.4 - Caenorhabditis elegans [Caenorhabditis elegans]
MEFYLIWKFRILEIFRFTTKFNIHNCRSLIDFLITELPLKCLCYCKESVQLKHFKSKNIEYTFFRGFEFLCTNLPYHLLTHMSAICLDRLIAIILYGRYNVLVTVQRIKTFSISCWALFLSTNVTLFFLQACCMIRPLESLNYYSFGYAENSKS